MVTGPLGTDTSSTNGWNSLATPGNLGTPGYTSRVTNPVSTLAAGGVGGTSMADVTNDLKLTGY